MTDQFHEETMFGLRRLVEGRAPTSKAAARVIAVMALLRERETRGCRYDQRDRQHDMLEGAEGLLQFARSPTYAWDSVDGMHQALVDLIPVRWVAGVQNIGYRLPLSDQANFELRMNEELGRCLCALDQCRAEYLPCKGFESKAKRWQRGQEVFAVARWNVIALFKDGCKMAEGIIETDHATSAAVKAKAAKAWALLDAVQI